MKRSADFDPARAQIVLAYIRQGGFPFVAADAAGVPPALLHDWLGRGERAGAREPLRGFAGNVRQALAQARLLSELAVCKHNPKFWLIHGPGKETSECTGWTTPVRPVEHQEPAGDSAQETKMLCSWILEALSPFPEARALVAQRLTHEPPPTARAEPSGRPPAGVFPLPPRWSGVSSSLN